MSWTICGNIDADAPKGETTGQSPLDGGMGCCFGMKIPAIRFIAPAPPPGERERDFPIRLPSFHMANRLSSRDRKRKRIAYAPKDGLSLFSTGDVSNPKAPRRGPSLIAKFGISLRREPKFACISSISPDFENFCLTKTQILPYSRLFIWIVDIFSVNLPWSDSGFQFARWRPNPEPGRGIAFLSRIPPVSFPFSGEARLAGNSRKKGECRRREGLWDKPKRAEAKPGSGRAGGRRFFCSFSPPPLCLGWPCPRAGAWPPCRAR